MRGEPRGVLFVAGMSHRTAPIELREQLALEEEKIREILGDLANHGVLQEVMILSTCNRVEVYGVAAVPGEARAQAFGRLGSHRGLAWRELEPLLYTATGEEAALHAFRVAASLDSMVLGEPQILGQVKQAVRVADNAGSLGTQLSRLFQTTFSVAKQVRTETALGAQSISMAAAALKLAQNLFGDLSRTRLLLIGVGEMVELAATYFAAQRPQSIVVANRTVARGEEFAARFGARAIPLSELPARLAEFDVVVTATASSLPIIGKGLLESALKARKRRPMFVVDLAVPRDVEAEASELRDLFLYTLDDLGKVVEQGAQARRSAVVEAEALVDRQVASFIAWQGARAAVPAIVELRRRADEYRRIELAKAKARLAKGEDPNAVLEALAKGLANKFLHHPSQALSRAAEGEREHLMRAIETLYPQAEADDAKQEP